MIGTIRKHQNWLWMLIITAVIISFVVYFTPNAGGKASGGGGGVNFGSIYGRPITAEMFDIARRETYLRYYFSYGTWPGRDSKQFGFDVERETLSRVFLIEKLSQMGVTVGDEAAAQWIADNFRDRQQKVFRKEIYDRFVSEVLLKEGLGEKDLQSFVRHEVGIQHLILLTGQSGKLVPRSEAETIYRQENQPVSAEVVFFSATNFVDGVKVTPEALTQFFTNRAGMYRLPERAVVRYVHYNLTNYFSEADQTMAKETNMNLRIDQFYTSRGADAFKDTNNVTMTPDAAKAKIRSSMRHDLALLEARKKSVELAKEVYDLMEKGPKTPAHLDTVAKKFGMPVSLTKPFNQFEGPAELKVLESFMKVAFSLTPLEPFASEPIVGEDGVYVIALEKMLPSEMPSLDTVRAKVTEDFKRSKSLEMARLAGMGFYARLTNGLAAGKTFDAVCKEAATKPVKLSPFSRSSKTIPELTSPGDVSDIKNMAFVVQPGKTSDFTPTSEGGFVLNVVARLPVDEARMKQEMPGFMASLQNSRQFDSFSEWFRHERDNARIIAPGAGTKQK